MTSHNIAATVFVYRHRQTQKIQCKYLDGSSQLKDHPDWEHIATLEPRMWIQAHWDDVEHGDI